jgi:hypothetical protein
MRTKLTRILTMSVALGALCWAGAASSATIRSGGAHFGGAHFGGAHFGGTHFGGAHLGAGGMVGRRGFGGAHLAGGHPGASRFRFASGSLPAGGARFGGRSGFNRNAFGDREGWNRWGVRGALVGEGRWGYRGWGGWGGGWAGPVFWPFMLGDVFSSTLWPNAYGYDPFWSYGANFDEGDGSYQPGGDSRAISVQSANSAGRSAAEAIQSCGGFAPGVTEFPIDRIRKAVRPTGEQTAALYDLAAGASRANTIVGQSCPSEPPLTPLARLDAMRHRLDATIKAIEIVRPALAAFYDSLSGEQRQRLDAIGLEDNHEQHAAATAAASGPETLASLCQRRAESFTRPMQHIEEVIQPTAQQQAAVDALKAASTKAADELLASCPQEIAQAPVGRLDAMDKRLEATVRAIEIVRPSLAALYESLSDDQKARFDAGKVPMQSASRAKIGTLRCNLAPAIGILVASRQRLSCTFTPDGAGPSETYFGHFTTVGLDIGVNGGGQMVWTVFAPISQHYRGALAGTYVGVSADAAIGAGLGANALVGGSQRSIALQPLSVEANTGVDLTAGVAALRLHWH